MCGRTCLTLEPNEIQCACKYKPKSSDAKSTSSKNNSKTDENSSGTGSKTIKKEENYENIEKLTPDWRSEYNCGKKYQPSFNISPTNITPVLVSTKHFIKKDDSSCEDGQQTRLLVPMMWGMIPFWHKGDYRKHGLTTHNCRFEHMLESKLYRGPFRKGQRCVVISEGFYEWQTTKSAKPSERAAYFIQMPQNDGIKIYDKSTWKDSLENLNLLKIAGLFDIWKDEKGDKIYSYSIITYESGDTLSWLHHRQPAVLETDDQVADWLDFDRVSDDKALSVLKIPPKLSWHQVSNVVNNSRNHSDQCNKPIENVKNSSASGSIVPKSKIMQSWLIIRKRKEDTLKQKFAADSDEDDDDDGDIDEEDDDMPKAKYRKLFYSSKSDSASQTTSDTSTETDAKVEIKQEM